MSNKVGDRVRLIRCNDQYSNLPSGTTGTVDFIDGMGTIHVKWDNGSRLGLIPGEDSWCLEDNA
ncbi:MAG: DUF4314 domain-containing protein [Gammaproteobacteria bacterium]|nr:DUF4314 domain-containing protein [Gammaproteobacteria bacterium]